MIPGRKQLAELPAVGSFTRRSFPYAEWWRVCHLGTCGEPRAPEDFGKELVHMHQQRRAMLELLIVSSSYTIATRMQALSVERLDLALCAGKMDQVRLEPT